MDAICMVDFAILCDEEALAEKPVLDLSSNPAFPHKNIYLTGQNISEISNSIFKSK